MKFDADNNEKIDFEEMKGVLAKHRPGLKDDELHKIFEDADKNNNG